MKRSLQFLIAIVCAAGTLQAVAVTQKQSPTPNGTLAPAAEEQSKGVRTSDWGFATPQMIPLDSQPVQSWGAAIVPGPRNTHASLPHGGPVTAGGRSNVPGRE
jgi:hypothetical protein